MLHPLARRFAALFLVFVAGWGLAGCPVESDQPLGPAEEATEDPAIYGAWYGNENDSPVWFHIYRPTDAAPGIVEATIVSIENDGTGESDRYFGHLTRIGDLAFANMQGPVGGGGPSGPYYIVNYRIAADGALELRMLKEETVQAAIAAKTLAGEVTAEGKPTAYVTDGSEKLRAFIAATAPDALFEAPIRLVPVKAQP